MTVNNSISVKHSLIQTIMKKILNHQRNQNINTQNLPTSHPSRQSLPKTYKPVIKVGYKVVESIEQPLRYKKPIIIARPVSSNRQGVKKVDQNRSQARSGVFLECQYIPQHPQKKQTQYHRKAVGQAHEKYRSGRQFCLQLMSQFNSRSRSSRTSTERSVISTQRSKLSGYRNEGIKDILEYHHAGSYRAQKLAQKCNNQLASQRCLSFGELHDFDFRRSKNAV